MKKNDLKIVCICNMNNNMFCLTRYLRDFGYNAELILFMDSAKHFLPEADVFNDDYKKYTKTVYWETIKNPQKRKETIINDLKEYNLIIGCGLVPGFLNFANITLDIFIPYGADIYLSPFYHTSFINHIKLHFSKLLVFLSPLLYKIPTNFSKKIINKINNSRYFIEAFAYSKSQYLGIKNCKYILQGDTSEELEKPLIKINSKAKRIFAPLPFLYTPLYNPTEIKKHYTNAINYPTYLKIRNENELVIFHHARHQWKTSPDIYTWKSNDKLIKGFAKFVKAYPNCTSKLVMTEYGDDVEESKKLVKDLNIEANVAWFKLMPRKEIMVAIDMFDIGSSEFANSWIIAGVIFENLAMAKPLLHYMIKENYKNTYSEIYPFLYVANDNDAFKRIEEYYLNPEHHKKEGEKAKEWFQKYGIDLPLSKIIDVIENA